MTITLPLPPSTNNLYLNAAGRGRRPTPAYSAWQWEAWAELRKQNPDHIPNGPYTLAVWLPDGMRGDIDNRVKPLSDLLVRHSITPDDRHCVRVVAERRADVPAGQCVVEISEA